MAKGRRLKTSRSERYLGSYGYGDGQGTVGDEAAELEEADVWSTADGLGDRSDQVVNDSRGEWSPRSGVASNGSMSIRSRSPNSPDGSGHVGGLTMAFGDSSDKTASPRIVHQFRGHDSVASPRRHMAASAPMNIPDWSKILRVHSVDSLHELDDELNDGDLEMIPPHEYLARGNARNEKIGGGSVFQGVGRTLKGRDMRRVRDAVWSQTGFYG